MGLTVQDSITAADKLIVEEGEEALGRFRRLMRELDNRSTSRNCFHRWEIELLLDLDQCGLRGSKRQRTIERYRRAVERQLERGGGRPLTLSEYIEGARRKAPPALS